MNKPAPSHYLHGEDFHLAHTAFDYEADRLCETLKDAFEAELTRTRIYGYAREFVTMHELWLKTKPEAPEKEET